MDRSCMRCHLAVGLSSGVHYFIVMRIIVAERHLQCGPGFLDRQHGESSPRLVESGSDQHWVRQRPADLRKLTGLESNARVRVGVLRSMVKVITFSL